MKAEVSSWTPGGTGTRTLLLNDDTINVKLITLWIGTTGNRVSFSYGSSDGSNHRSVSVLDDSPVIRTESTTYAITHYKKTSNALDRIIAGYVTSFSTTGEVQFYFDDADLGYPLMYSVIGD